MTNSKVFNFRLSPEDTERLDQFMEIFHLQTPKEALLSLLDAAYALFEKTLEEIKHEG